MLLTSAGGAEGRTGVWTTGAADEQVKSPERISRASVGSSEGC